MQKPVIVTAAYLCALVVWQITERARNLAKNFEKVQF